MSNSTKEETDLDEEAARRALDFYLNPTPTPRDLERSLWTLREGVSNAQACDHAMALLRCASATCEDVLCMALSEKKGEEAGRKWKSQERRGPEERTAEKPVPNRR
ncbi:hypothetical protein [Pseudomonas mosselii]|uniref:DUF3077 domain-containing protein n=1 Tax=Pseudomonas mosselii TaxID=78327 RepID=A0A7W2PYX2_9PSED|nr:hypothetical protein [Pseudomonas mosselii]MBA6065974.1 hypothetical protein [Pseudomonas mosselii]